MSERVALLTGSMNPFTRGHKYLVDTALLIFDRVIIGIGTNPEKTGVNAFLSQEQRHRIVDACVAEHAGLVSIEQFSGATIDFAASVSATAIIRGLRDETDQDYEASLSHVNRLISELEHERFIPTIYLPSPPSMTEISSSRVRELVALKRKPAVLNEYLLPQATEIVVNELY